MSSAVPSGLGAPDNEVVIGEWEPRGLSREWRAFWRHPLTWVGLSVLLLIILFCFVGPQIDRVQYNVPNLLDTLQPPSAAHLLGTDALGRDELARLMVGGQLSLEVGFASAIVSMIIGVAYGLFSGLIGGWLDEVLMRIVDVLLAIPIIFLLLLLDSMFQPTAGLLTFIIAVTSWFGVARLVRGEVLTIKRLEFVEAARATGAGMWRIILRHLLPNVMGIVIVTTTFQVGGAILTIAGLSFLGLGLPPPTPNWGAMVSNSLQYVFQNAWWLIYPAGLAIVFVEVAVNFIGDAMRQAFDPRLRGRGSR